MRNWHWNLDEIRRMSNIKIIRKLRRFGVDFRIEKFREEAPKFYSAENLADHWWEIYEITADGYDEDFIWMAAIILWERLLPDVTNFREIDNEMQIGYDLLRENKTTEACKIWLEVWNKIKKKIGTDFKSAEEADKVFNGIQSIFNWCQDLEMELGNAGRDDPSFYEKRIQYCRELYTLFPETDDLTIHNTKRAEAESHFALGMQEKGEELFKKLIEEYPDNVWGYIGWGDMYGIIRMNPSIPVDYDKAIRIYKMALERDLDSVQDKEDVLDRIRSAEEEKAEQES
jgi:tetratricopeptide (TPR) repeat protein